jgi:GrpB-like predicted nucleotidyltransferase (UPF0157 family)
MNSNPAIPKNRPVVIVPYDPEWVKAFQNEAILIHLAIGRYITVIEHIGSTSVPGLAAKPIIDILIGVKSLSDTRLFVPRLFALGYSYYPEYEDELPERRYLDKTPPDGPGFHLHMVEPTTVFFRRHLFFRDYLRSHPASAAEYAALKNELAQKFGSDREGYTNAKTDFIKRIENEAQILD